MINNRNLFDTANPDDSSNIGSYLRDAAGNLITSTTIGPIQALDVNVANTITVTNDANYAEDTAHVTADIGTFILSRRADTPSSSAGTDGDYSSLNTDANGRLYTQIYDGGNSITVDAVDLDIRNLTFATDTVDVSGSTVAATQSGAWTTGRTWTLAQTTDSVKIGDGTDFIAINADGSINITDNGGSITVDGTVTANAGTGTFTVSDAALANTAIANAAQSVTTTSAALIASPLTNRKYASIYNNGNKAIYFGTGTVTAANGFPLLPGGYAEWRLGAAQSLNSVAGAGTQDVRTLEFS